MARVRNQPQEYSIFATLAFPEEAEISNIKKARSEQCFVELVKEWCKYHAFSIHSTHINREDRGGTATTMVFDLSTMFPPQYSSYILEETITKVIYTMKQQEVKPIFEGVHFEVRTMKSFGERIIHHL